MRHQGTKPLTTPRLYLRRFVLQDAQNMFDNWARDAEVTRFLTWHPHANVEESRQILQQWIHVYDRSEEYRWAIVLKQNNEVIGSIDVVAARDIFATAEVGYCIGKNYWGQGLMSEALQTVLTYLCKQIGYHRIEATHDIDNPASGKVMQKCGMRREGIKREGMLRKDGTYADLSMYAVLSQELPAVDRSPESDEASFRRPNEDILK